MILGIDPGAYGIFAGEQFRPCAHLRKFIKYPNRYRCTFSCVAASLVSLIAICLVFKNDLFRMLVEIIHIFQDLTANFKIYIDNKMHSAQTTPYRKILCNNTAPWCDDPISTIPTGILGYLLQNLVDRWSSSLPVTGLGLLITAVLLLVVDNWQLGNKLPKHITVPQALAIGVCQGISVIPGISRSGITITAGFLCGFRRGFAIRYSYLVSIPAILGAMILECGKLESKSVTWSLGFSYTAGMLTAAVVGYFSIRFMLAFIKKKKLRIFSHYCFIMGILAIVCYFV